MTQTQDQRFSVLLSPQINSLESTIYESVNQWGGGVGVWTSLTGFFWNCSWSARGQLGSVRGQLGSVEGQLGGQLNLVGGQLGVS
jgi:hypothetical protein